LNTDVSMASVLKRLAEEKAFQRELDEINKEN
jgi:uncharacterized protein YihD (DUF1040 family)